jgi:hypothetical protein
MQPEYPFVLVLANKERRAAHFISLVLIGITIGTAIIYTATNLSPNRIALILLVILLVIILYFKLKRNLENGFPRLMWPIAMAGLCWFQIPSGFFIGLVYLVAAIFEKQSHIPIEIGIDPSGITFNHFPQKFHEWNHVQHLIVKDGLVTIDYKNNKVFQKELANSITPEDEAAVNQYCRQFLL